VSDNGDQLARLGEQVVATITAAYNPHNDSTLALALHPGQALADNIVQGGVINELRLSEWLAGQYDNPMMLKLADGTPVTTTTLGGITAKSAYVTMARWGQPAVAADSAAFPRLAQLISDVRQDIGEHPEALPFGCEPTNFALTDCPAWQVFDTKISTHTSEETVTPASDSPPSDSPPSDSSTSTVESNPDLWKIRALSEVTVAELPQRRRVREEVYQLSQEMPSLSNEVVVERLQNAGYAVQPEIAVSPVDSATLDTSVASFALADTVSNTASFALADTVSNTVSLGVADTVSFALADRVSDIAIAQPRSFVAAVADVAPARSFRNNAFAKFALADGETNEVYLSPAQAAPAMVRLDATLAQELVHVNVSDLVDQPAVSTATTSDSSLHVHFEYVVLSITRLLAGRPWWHPEFVEEPAWFVPGMKRGALVPETTDPAYGHCLPQSLLLVRNVSLTGVWSDEAKATMNESVHYFGPFLMSPSDQTQTTTDAQSAEQTTVLGLGVQVIGELCSKLPALPPMDDPALAAH
jgi:hypothetical protein